MLLGWRPHDLDTGYLPFLAGPGNAVGTSDPVFMASLGFEAEPQPPVVFPFDHEKHRALLAQGDKDAQRATHIGMKWIGEASSGKFRTWVDVKFLRDNWDGPLVLKGILSVADAHSAIDAGADGIVVSNHGGRQVDGAIPSLLALEHITADKRVKEAQEGGKFTVLFDSGIRTGADIIKALALGAQAVLGTFIHPYAPYFSQCFHSCPTFHVCSSNIRAARCRGASSRPSRRHRNHARIVWT